MNSIIIIQEDVAMPCQITKFSRVLRRGEINMLSLVNLRRSVELLYNI